MEAGYDYLLANRRSRIIRGLKRSIKANPLQYAGGALVVLGLIGVLIGSLFFFVFNKSTEELERDLVAVAQPTPQPVAVGELASVRLESPAPLPAPQTSEQVVTVVSRRAPEPVTELAPSMARQAGLYPGEDMKAFHWSEPLAFAPALSIGDMIGEFGPVTPSEEPLSAPTRLIIPRINVESDVRELRILNLGNSQAWETPKNVVGHIPVTANPGEAGSTWLFGHLESPIQREGSVFAQLPEIPGLLRRGEEVYAVVENGSESYLYRIVESNVVPQSELSLTDDGTSQLLMVTCVPRFVYDHRLVVRGVLEGVLS